MKKPISGILAALVVALAATPFCAGAQTQERPAPQTQERTGTQERFAELPSVEANHSVSLDLIGLHYAYELPFARTASIIGRVGANLGARRESGLFGNYFIWAIAPSIEIEPRWYYGLDRREMLGRSTYRNAGSFLALQIKSIMPFGYISDGSGEIVGETFVTPMWGMRRVWGDHWLFEFTTGINFSQRWLGYIDRSIHIGARFGYTF